MKRIKSLDYLLSFGVLILFFAGISLMTNQIFEIAMLKCSGLILLSFIFYILAILFEKLLKASFSNKVSYGLASLTLVITYYVAGTNELFGNWFSISGEGVQIFLASIAFLIAILSIITIVLYKNYNLVHITFISLLVMACNILIYFNFNVQLIFIVISSLLVLANIFKVNKYLYSFSKVAIYVNALLCLGLCFEESFVLSTILFSINVFGILFLLYKNKGFENELLSFLLMVLFVLAYIFVSSDYLSDSLTLVVTVSLLCTIDLFINTFRLFTNKFVKIIYKIFNAIVLLSVLINVDFDVTSNMISIIFIILTSIVCSFVLQNNDYEEYVLPFKLSFIIYFVDNLFVTDIISPLFGVQAAIYALIYRKLKKDGIKTLYLIMSLGSIFLMLATNNSTIIHVVIASIILTLEYLLIRKNRSEDSLLFIVYLLFMWGLLESSSFVEALVAIIIGGLLTFIHKNNKFSFVLSVGFLLLVIDKFFSLVFANTTIYILLISLMYFMLMGIAAEILFERNKSKNIFAGIMFSLGLITVIGNDVNFLLLIYTLIVSLVIILLSIKNSDYKSLYYVGLVFGIISLLYLLSFLENIPTALYLMIIAITIIIAVSIMIYRFQNRKEEIPVKISNPVKNKNVCPKCKSKINKDDVYCGECGTKVK